MNRLFFLLLFLSLSGPVMSAHPSLRHNIATRSNEKPPRPLPLTISQIIGNGAYLMLSDDSVWAIAPADILLSGAWISAAEITIQESSDPNYPFLLFNSITQDSIHARKATLDEVRQKMRSTEVQKQQAIMEQKKTEEKASELKK